MANQFGDKIKKLREINFLLQRQVASELQIDTPMLSKIERGERRAKKEQVIVLAKLYKADSGDLIILWLADQLVKVVENEKFALQAMLVAEEEVKYQTKKAI